MISWRKKKTHHELLSDASSQAFFPCSSFATTPPQSPEPSSNLPLSPANQLSIFLLDLQETDP